MGTYHREQRRVCLFQVLLSLISKPTWAQSDEIDSIEGDTWTQVRGARATTNDIDLQDVPRPRSQERRSRDRVLSTVSFIFWHLRPHKLTVNIAFVPR